MLGSYDKRKIVKNGGHAKLGSLMATYLCNQCVSKILSSLLGWNVSEGVCGDHRRKQNQA